MTKWVYAFGDGRAEGSAELRNLLGGKGANLAEMARLGVPVPPGFTITTDVCTAFYERNKAYPDGLQAEVDAALEMIEKGVGMRFGDPDNPLLVSVRSGARVSMPGMMDTVLNLGLNDETAAGLARRADDPRFAYDSYRRFIQMYSDVVLGIDHGQFEDILESYKSGAGYANDVEMSGDDWQRIIAEFKHEVSHALGESFPLNPRDQLWGAIGAVFGSWMNSRAITYRRLHDIPEEWGTAVTVQAMVFGNMGDDCATGVCFSRDPSTGEKIFYGEYLVNAQGEDVVAGIRTPQYMTREAREKGGDDRPSMEEAMPAAFAELEAVKDRLEAHYCDMQDMEFTVQGGKLWMLQTRGGKRTAKAALRIAVDMAHEGLIDRKTAIMRLDAAHLDQLLHPTLDPDADRQILTKGLPASPGAAAGKVVFTAEDAEAAVKGGDKVLLVRVETSPEDIGGMHVAEGILTSRGGMTSHAAVVARGIGTPCVSGAGELKIDIKAKTISIAGKIIREGDLLTIDGGTGEVMLGEVPTIQPELSGDFGELMAWADEFRTLKVRTNADTPRDAQMARNFGAEGIGLCRTEHMFFDPGRIVTVREMILAGEDTDARKRALEKLLPYQRDDFIELFTIMAGLPVTIRLLDPPLHEFLPQSDADIEAVAKSAGVGPATVRARIEELHEVNPMLGHRGCRLGLSYPEIYEMQARAIFEAAIKVSKCGEVPVLPEVMVPLVATRREFDLLKTMIDEAAAAVFAAEGKSIAYQVGTMIELPRAALRAGDIAESAEFFSFGTNDLTQTALGISRDDSTSFLQLYRDKGIYPKSPFASIDLDGVGELVRIGVERGRAVRPDLKLGICGEHGGDPASIRFFQSVGLDYVSASPFRVPIARLAAAQAALAAADGM